MEKAKTQNNRGTQTEAPIEIHATNMIQIIKGMNNSGVILKAVEVATKQIQDENTKLKRELQKLRQQREKTNSATTYFPKLYHKDIVEKRRKKRSKCETHIHCM